MKYNQKVRSKKVDIGELLAEYGGDLRKYLLETYAYTLQEQEQMQINLSWREFEPYIPKEVSFDQICSDYIRALAELDAREEPLREEHLAMQAWLNSDDENDKGENSMSYHARCNRTLLPAEKRRKQTRKAKVRQAKLFGDEIRNKDHDLFVDSGICHHKSDTAKKILRHNRKDKNLKPSVVAEHVATILKYKRGITRARFFGAYDKAGVYIRPTDVKAPKAPIEECEAALKTTEHIKSPKGRYLNAKERILQEKKSLKCGNFKKYSQTLHSSSYRLVQTSLPSDPGKRPYPYF